MRNVVNLIRRLSDVPTSSSAYQAWIEGADAITFLEENLHDTELVLLIYARYAYCHTVLVRHSLSDPLPVEECLEWDMNAQSTWGISVRFTDPPQIEVEPPLSMSDAKLFDGAEQIVYSRNFDGCSGEKYYYEISQKFLHIMELHHVPERKAWCKLDANGDIYDVIRVVNFPTSQKDWDCEAILIDRDELDKYLALTDMSALRTFDFTRFPSAGFTSWRHDVENTTVVRETLAYRSHVQTGDASYLRGAQVIVPIKRRDEIRKRYASFGSENKEYATFIVQDWRHDSIVEVSCAPGATANYFVKSDLPFELSPAFFRPEVLAKYKADTEKYSIEDRHIYCRGAWSLRGVDVNEAGQVHAYLVDLRCLPYQEQLYWKAHNEKPKGTTSGRAFLADFEGSWDQGYHPLNELKGKLRSIDGEVSWWRMKDVNLINKVNYPVSASSDEFANEIMNLDKLLVEGLIEKNIKQCLQSANVVIDPTWRSIMCLEELLVNRGKDRKEVVQVLAPLRQVHHLRSKLKGHVSGTDAREIQREIIQTHGSYRECFKFLCAACDESIGNLTAALSNLPHG